jgi:hypothetical protein
LADAGIRASVVGESVGNGAGIGFIGQQVAPRVWVREDDLQRARHVLERWVRECQQPVGGDVPGDEDDTTEEPSDKPSCGLTTRLIRIGRWFIGGFLCVGSSTGFVLFLYLTLRAAREGNQVRELLESAFCAAMCGALAVLAWFLLKKFVFRKG